MLGIAFGFGFMILAVGLGLVKVFDAFPQVHEVMGWAGTAYLVYLAWCIAMAGRSQDAKAGGKPLSLLQAALFQWINPKGWMMSVSALAAFTTQGANYAAGALMVAAVFFSVTFPATTT